MGLGALAHAIDHFEGGVVMITHNDGFHTELCPETWVLEHGTLDARGDAAWMKNALAEKVEFKLVEEMVDALGNTIKVNNKKDKSKMSRREKKAIMKRIAAKKKAGEELDSEEEEFDLDL